MNTTRHLGAALMAVSLTVGLSVGAAQAQEQAPLATVDASGDSTAKQWLRDIWRVFRVYSPTQHKDNDDGRQRPVVAGLRGNPAEGTALQPYWQGGLETQRAHLSELDGFRKAQRLAEEGHTQAAVDAFDAFLLQHPNSALIPGVRIALGALYAELGDTRRAAALLAELAAHSDGLGEQAGGLRERLM